MTQDKFDELRKLFGTPEDGNTECYVGFPLIFKDGEPTQYFLTGLTKEVLINKDTGEQVAELFPNSEGRLSIDGTLTDYCVMPRPYNNIRYLPMD